VQGKFTRSVSPQFYLMFTIYMVILVSIVEDTFRKVNVILQVILRFLVSVGMYVRNRPISPRNSLFFFEKLMISQLAKKFLISVEP
jgi:hypothetical protein